MAHDLLEHLGRVARVMISIVPGDTLILQYTIST
jgi:hypothetical protein